MAKTIIVGTIMYLIGLWIGKLRGKSEFATFVWNLLADNRSESMVEAVLLYCAANSINIRLRNGWKDHNDAYEALKSKTPLRDDC